MEIITLKITGTSPLLMHSDRFANPLDSATKEHKVLTSKKTKTEDDHIAIAKSEWRGGLYWSDTVGVYIPTANIRRTIWEGAKLSKLGKQIERGTMILDDKVALKYQGPKDPEKLWESGKYYDCRSVVISGKRLMRYRPLFRDWEVEVELTFDSAQIEESQLLRVANDAGNLIGLGDFRPNKGGSFGRFSVEKV